MSVDIYDKNGKPTAYILNDKSIFLWDGHAVACITHKNLYGWNGKHLGWFVNGIIYDSKGLQIGFIKEKCPVAVYASPSKPSRYATPAKSANYAAPAMPALSTSKSGMNLISFLNLGK